MLLLLLLLLLLSTKYFGDIGCPTPSRRSSGSILTFHSTLPPAHTAKQATDGSCRGSVLLSLLTTDNLSCHTWEGEQVAHCHIVVVGLPSSGWIGVDGRECHCCRRRHVPFCSPVPYHFPREPPPHSQGGKGGQPVSLKSAPGSPRGWSMLSSVKPSQSAANHRSHLYKGPLFSTINDY